MSHQLIEQQVIYHGKKVRLEVHHLLDDETGQRRKMEVCVHPGAVVILPFLDENTVLLIRNRRHAVGQILLELPAGTLEPGELPMNCAGRELLEETGYLANRIVPLGSFYSSPGILSEKMHAFAAFELEEGERALDEGEEIDIEPTRYVDALSMIRLGEIADAKTIATLLLYDRFWRAGGEVAGKVEVG